MNENKKAAGWYPAAFQENISKYSEIHGSKELRKKPLPPYGGKLLSQVAEGRAIKNDIWLFFGQNCWENASKQMDKQVVLALPYGEEPEKYDWPINHIEILAIDCSYLSKQYVWAAEENYIRKLAYILLAAGSPVIRVICWNGSLVVYRRNRQ